MGQGCHGFSIVTMVLCEVVEGTKSGVEQSDEQIMNGGVNGLH